MIEKVFDRENILAIIIRNDYDAEGIQFLTPNEYSQQMAYMHHPTDKRIDAHVHNEVHRNIFITQEVLIIKKGILRVDFYGENKDYVGSKKLYQGDIIMLVSGGHGFQVEEEIQMVEIKQGPYSGELDKERFTGIEEKDIKLL